MKNILVTGSKGYIGQHLVKMLKQNPYYRVVPLDLNEVLDYRCDIRFGDHVATFNEEKIDTVIHLAALVKVGESTEKPVQYYDTNINGTLNLLNYITFNNFIFASTGAASNPSSPYGFSKRVAEDIVREKCANRNYTSFRFYNVIGTDGFPPTNPEGLMMNLMNAKETGKFTIFGIDYNTKDGTCVREYVHVNDICRALIKAIDYPSNKIENLAYGDPRTTLEIVKTFLNVNQITCNVEYGPRRKGDLEACYLENPSSYMERNYTYEQMLKI
jgi:UDP-glucose 4-epimerase